MAEGLNRSHTVATAQKHNPVLREAHCGIFLCWKSTPSSGQLDAKYTVDLWSHWARRLVSDWFGVTEDARLCMVCWCCTVTGRSRSTLHYLLPMWRNPLQPCDLNLRAAIARNGFNISNWQSRWLSVKKMIFRQQFGVNDIITESTHHSVNQTKEIHSLYANGFDHIL